MRKSKFFIISLMLFIVIIQIGLLLSGTKYKWKIIILEFIVIFALLIIYAFIISYFYRKLIRNYNNLNYDYVIKNGLRLRKLIPKKGVSEEIALLLAVCFFSKDDDETFKIYINLVKDKKLIIAKYYWLLIYNIINKDLEETEKHLALLVESKESKHYELYYEMAHSLLKLLYLDDENKNKEIEKLQLLFTNKRIVSFLDEEKI